MDVKKLIKLTQAELEEYEERAAILQYDGGYERIRAEEVAYMAVIEKRK